MIRCEICNEQFNTKEEYDAHLKYILEIPIRQYEEMVKETDRKLLEFINEKKEYAKPS